MAKQTTPQTQQTQPSTCPKAPADVTARKTAAAFWNSHAESLAAAGRLRQDNAEGLALLSHLYADCRDLAEQLAGEGWVTSTDKGQQANPVARLLRDARRDFVSLAREYGMTPAAETRFPPEAVDHAEESAEEAALRAFCG
jgi:P27 family predicted phage terminase small subunit